MATSPDASPAGQERPSGRRYGRWAAGPLLGQGSLGRVYLAHDGAGRAASLRVVRASLARDPSFRTRFAREVLALGAVRGRGVAALLDADAYGAAPWLAVEYVAGPTLAARVGKGGGPLGTAGLRVLASALAGALDDIHRAGLVHGGLRPSNVLLSADGPRVTDFGVSAGADVTAGAEAETPGFTAPETLAQGVAKPPADIFSLGAVLAYAAAGRGPFEPGDGNGDDVPEVQGPTGALGPPGVPDLTGVPEELLPLVTACLSRHPAARPAPRTIARMAGLPLPGSRRRALTLADTLFLAQLAVAAYPLGGRWEGRTGVR
ncbi:serine/threonine-protein kinase [Streptomyces longisporoflavus]|uniref:Serine/threonine-protein kinase n=1 Tax=Streptomyces longisporoflavus TaxID=28044 RepID=A0ABW7R080_9ACTN